MALTQEMILTFLLEHGGKVKNSELVSKFKGLINSSDPAEKKRNRDLFKRLVNNVAVVKQVDDVKYVAVKKKYQGTTGEKITLDNSSFDLKSPCSSSKPARDSSEIENVDIINNNYCHCSTQTVSNSSTSGKDAGRPDYNVESLTARVLSVTSDARSGSVFALVAIKSPQCESQNDENGKTRLKTLTADAEPPSPMTMKVKTTAYQSCFAGEGFPYRSLRAKRKELEAQGSPQLRRCSKITKPGGNDSDVIPLGSMEHEWLVKSATGSWRQIYSLLLQDPHLVEKRNFMSGFTILHWAAKSGNGEMVCKVIDVSRQSGAGIDVNAKSYDGYTPLHIAAIHSRERVCSLLVCEYGASTNIRDNSGKKPYRYLSQDVSTEIRKMLGDPRCLQQDAGNYLKDDQNLHRRFNTLSKLFQPHVAGHKKKYRRRPSFHFIREKEHCT
ncbi:ankyrin repeat domain-containing protein SOWAHA [Ctenopharyngodon idella]|uniref:ankyrin repeat domain-containing protein SOWAHA n=1 Tax=Ctenopharyngodon idella TaxID=7959 RepID=UPI00223195A9|nr:ankyrin repeat domain-containing protein SOWAHA [Ctenopharyngodon idella]